MQLLERNRFGVPCCLTSVVANMNHKKLAIVLLHHFILRFMLFFYLELEQSFKITLTVDEFF